jgi:hypothetical protein
MSIFERLAILRTEPELGGLLITSTQGEIDIPLVHRTWSLYQSGELYGPRFHLSTYKRVESLVHDLATYIGSAFGFYLLAVPVIRWLLQYFTTPSSEVPREE